MDTNVDNSSFTPDPTNVYDMRVGKLLNEDFGHMEKIMSRVDGMGS